METLSDNIIFTGEQPIAEIDDNWENGKSYLNKCCTILSDCMKKLYHVTIAVKEGHTSLTAMVTWHVPFLRLLFYLLGRQ